MGHLRRRDRPPRAASGARLAACAWIFGVHVLTGCIHAYFEGPLPQAEGTVSAAGIGAETWIQRDGLGIPTITGSGLPDLAFAQGYAHAQDRLWQMDLTRRIASGRLAEIAGPEALPVDRLVRIVGLRRVASREIEQLEPETLRVLDSYAAGVNGYIRSLGGDVPLGFKLLDFGPEPWRPVDSLAIAKLVAFQLSFNWESELGRQALLDRFSEALGAARIQELFPDNRSDPVTILPEVGGAVGRGAAPAGVAPALAHDPGIPRLDAAGILAAIDETRTVLGWAGVVPASNNWVVDGTMSASGKPLLANDPHLMPQMPSVWYENRLADRSSGGWLAGASFPGIPGVIIGRTDRFAWGFTTSFADVQDLFLEKLDDYGSPRRYLDEGVLKDLDIVDERIQVRGGEEVIERVYLTSRGPLLSRWLTRKRDPLKPYGDFSFAWTGLVPSRTADAIVRLHTARDWKGFLEAFRGWSTPSQNVVYADVDGNIGYVMAGLVPVRKNGDGTLPVAGWTGEHAWTGTIPFEELPALFNPPGHQIVTANNRVAPASYPHWLGQESVTGWRAARIAGLLGEREKFSAEDFARMQGDVVSLAAREILPRILAIQPKSDLERDALSELRDWDGRVEAGSAAAALYEVTWWRLLWLTLGDELEELAPAVIGQGATAFNPSNPFFWHTARLVRRKLSAEPDWAWFDDVRTRRTEAASDILARAFSEAVAYLRRERGSDLAEWRWGEIHAITFRNLLGRSALAEFLFDLSRGPYPLGGDTDTILQSAFAPARPYSAQAWIPSYRMVVDMAEPAVALVRNTTGQSDHPSSPHYDDQIQDWLAVSPRRDVVAATGGPSGGIRLVPEPGTGGGEGDR